MIWTAVAGVRYSIEQVRKRRTSVLLNQIWKWCNIVMKSSALLSIWVRMTLIADNVAESNFFVMCKFSFLCQYLFPDFRYLSSQFLLGFSLSFWSLCQWEFRWMKVQYSSFIKTGHLALYFSRYGLDWWVCFLHYDHFPC